MHFIPFLRLEFSAAPRRYALFTLLAIFMLLAGCGFKLKGVTPLPFDSLYTNISANSEFGAAIRRAVKAASPGTSIVEDPKLAQARLIQLRNNQRLRELSIDADGRVEEYELNLEFTFQLSDAAGRLLLPPTTLRAVREIPYDDSIVQARQSEITTVFQQMQQSMVDRILRLLSSPNVEEAFANAEDQPFDDSATDLAPVSNDPGPDGSNMWGAPRLNPAGPTF